MHQLDEIIFNKHSPTCHYSSSSRWDDGFLQSIGLANAIKESLSYESPTLFCGLRQEASSVTFYLFSRAKVFVVISCLGVTVGDP